MALQAIVCIGGVFFGASIVYEDLRQTGTLDGLGATVGIVVISCALAAAIWSHHSVKMSTTSVELAAVMGALLPGGVWIGFGWLLNFDDHPTKVLATGLALCLWFALSFSFGRQSVSSTRLGEDRSTRR